MAPNRSGWDKNRGNVWKCPPLPSLWYCCSYAVKWNASKVYFAHKMCLVGLCNQKCHVSLGVGHVIFNLHLGGGSLSFVPNGRGGSCVFSPPHFQMLRPTTPRPVLFDQSLIETPSFVTDKIPTGQISTRTKTLTKILAFLSKSRFFFNFNTQSKSAPF